MSTAQCDVAIIGSDTRRAAPTSLSPYSYCITIFLGAFLLFSVQLVTAKYFLPWFGGTPALWTTCMFFFQVLLLAGYGYAHGLNNRLGPHKQFRLHLSVLFGSLAVIVGLALLWNSPLLPNAHWRPQVSDHPAWHVILLLSVSAGLPYFVLSTTSPLLQSWFARSYPRSSAYRLYALSNLGSLLGLLTYPSLVEPWLTLRMQARVWSLGFLIYSIACAYCTWQVRRSSSEETPHSNSRAELPNCEAPSVSDRLLWLALAAAASILFLATTNQICQDVAVVPFLWVLPLSIYLVSFIISFDKSKWYSRGVLHPLFGLCLLLACFVLNGGALTNIFRQVLIYLFTLFVGCMILHGELARAKPHVSHLTSFYLMVSLGGAIGGVFVALVAPAVFRNFWEYQIGLWGTATLMLVMLVRDKNSWLQRTRFGLLGLAIYVAALPGFLTLATDTEKFSLEPLLPVIPVLVGTLIVAQMNGIGAERSRARAIPTYGLMASLVVAALLFFGAKTQLQGSVLRVRNFYGVLSIREVNPADSEWHAYSLNHGKVIHGFQFTSPTKRGLVTSCFGPDSGAGKGLAAARSEKPHLRIGIVGLGIGTLAAYGKAGDYIRVYEINPDVIKLANDARYFRYLKDCPARVETIEGDGRLSMERELQQGQRQNFDFLVIDAFSGDAIPLHLLTEQAFAIYLRELNPEGTIAVHVSNTYVDLRPVLARIAERFRLRHIWMASTKEDRVARYNEWVLLSANASLIDSLPEQTPEPDAKAMPLWSDDYSNLFRVLRR